MKHTGVIMFKYNEQEIQKEVAEWENGTDD